MRSIRIGVAFAMAFGVTLSGAVTSRDFYEAIRGNNLSRLKQMLDAGASADLRDSRGSTPLMHAAAIGSIEAMTLLLRAGADVNAKNGLDATALLWGAGDPAKARLLVEAGAQVDVRSKIGRSPLTVAATGPGSAATVRLLLEKGADPQGADKALGNTALSQAARVNDLDSMRVLLAAKSDVNAADRVGFTPLMYAALHENAAAVTLLLAKGASVNAAHKGDLTVRHGPIAISGMTALMAAASGGSPEIVSALLNAGAEVNAKDVRGMTALMFALASDASEPRVVRLLLDHGADPGLKSAIGEDASDWARKFAEPENLRLLHAAPAESSAAVRPAGLAKKDRGKAIESAIALLQGSVTEYFKESGCVGCHHQNLAGFAEGRARKNGFHVDETAAAEHLRVVKAEFAGASEALREGTFISADSLAYALFQLSEQAYPADDLTDTIVSGLALQQQQDGSWCGLGPRPPLEDRPIVRTALAADALATYRIPARKAEFDERIARARLWLEQARARVPHERSYRLLGLVWTGAGRGVIESAAASVRADQRADGGWPQLSTLASDAYATGLALFALRQAGVAASDGAYERGVRYLLDTQLADGSWHVASRAPKLQPYFQSGFPHDHDQWISAAATAWAAAALAEGGEPAARRASLR